MDILRRQDLEALMEAEGRFCISAYMPTHRGGRDIREDPIRLKNRLDKAETMLQERGLNEREVETLLEPAQDLWRNQLFWEKQSDGLAVFVRDGELRYYRLPLHFEPLTVVGHRFHLKPLLQLLGSEDRYFLLALSQGNVRLYQGTGYSISELDPEQLPDSLAEALRFEDPEQHFQYHTSTRTPGVTLVPLNMSGAIAARPGEFHGQGGAADEDTERTYMMRYLQQVDEGIQDLLDPLQEPLIIAGLDSVQAMYRDVNEYPALLEEGIDISPEGMSLRELHQRSWQVLEARRAAARGDAAERYRQLQGMEDERASAELETIVPAAHYGRVETLFVPLWQQVWGSFDASTGSIELDEEPGPENQDLLDLAAVHTLLNDGTVYPVEIDAVPGSEAMAAIFRY
jgi:hypothetical protein